MKPVAYPRGLEAQGRGHPGQGASPMQCAIKHTLTNSHTKDNLEIPISLPHRFLDLGRKPEYLEETPKQRVVGLFNCNWWCCINIRRV